MKNLKLIATKYRIISFFCEIIQNVKGTGSDKRWFKFGKIKKL